MFRIVKSLAKAQYVVPLQFLSKTSKLPFSRFMNKISSHSYHPSVSSFGFSSMKSLRESENQYIQDLHLIPDANIEELAPYQEKLQKYISSQDFAEFTQEDSTVLLQAFYQIGNNLLNVPERENDALKYFEEAFAFAKTIGIKESKELAVLHHGLGAACVLHKRIEEALVNFDKSQEMFNKVGVDDDSAYVVLQGYTYQGSIALAQGNFDQAEKYFQAASEAVPETNVIEDFLMGIYENLAFINFKKEDFEKAQELAIKAIDLQSKDDVVNPALLRELASSFYVQGKLDDALKYAQMMETALKSDPEGDEYRVIENLILTGNIYTQKSDETNAFTYFKQANDILEKSPEVLQDFPHPEHFYLPAAFTYFEKGKDQEAAELFTKGISFLRSQYGENSLEVATNLASWALTLETNQNTKKGAYDTFKESLKIFQKLGDECIPDVIHNTTRLADLSRSVGKPGESAEYCRKALKLINESGQNTDWLDDIHRLLGAELWYGGEKAEGLEHLEKAVRLCEESGDRSGKLQFNCYFLADAYFEKKEFEKAEGIAKKGLQLCLFKFGKGHNDTKESLSLLLKILKAQRKTDEIAKILQAFGFVPGATAKQSIVMGGDKSH